MAELDIQAAKKRCEAVAEEEWTLRREDDPASNVDVMWGETVIATMGDFFPEAEFVVNAKRDLPAALEALEKARGENERLKAVLDTANRQHQWDAHGEFGREAGCLDCQRYADVL